MMGVLLLAGVALAAALGLLWLSIHARAMIEAALEFDRTGEL